MRRSRMAVIAAAATVTLALGSNPVSGQAEGPPGEDDTVVPGSPFVLPISVDPTSGPIGTTVHVSGGECPGGEVNFSLDAGTGIGDATHDIDGSFTEADADGNWSGELIVHDTMYAFSPDPEIRSTPVPVVPGEDYFIFATCQFIEGGPWGLSAYVDFDITGYGAAPPHTDPPPAAAPIAPAAQPQASPAVPVVTVPTYTG